jgi:hypothetical protein
MVRSRASPPLKEEEWIILLDIYLRHRGEALTASHPMLLESQRSPEPAWRADGT